MKRAAQYLFIRNGVYQYRQIIPKDLRAFYTRTEFRVSLRTRCPREARYRATKLAAEILEQFHRIYMRNKDDLIKTGLMTAFNLHTGFNLIFNR